MLNVKLIAYTPEPEKVIASAAKLCYSHAGADEIMEDLTDEATEKFLNRLVSMGHGSPTEHATFTFAIEGVSRSLTHQLVRHRLASYSQKSQRYVTEGDFEYIIPPQIEDVPEAKGLFLDVMGDIQKTYDKISALLAEKHEQELIASGVPEKKAKNMAEKTAIEDARYVLPNACETKIVVTMNARELAHFFNQRCCNRAQWEIRECATKMLKLVKQVAPTLFKNAGPRCLCGSCPEGAMCCGKAEEVRERFEHL